MSAGAGGIALLSNHLSPADAAFIKANLPNNPYEAPAKIKRLWLLYGLSELEETVKVPATLPMAAIIGLALYVGPPEALFRDHEGELEYNQRLLIASQQKFCLEFGIKLQ